MALNTDHDEPTGFYPTPRSATMSTTTPAPYTITSGEKLAAAMAACVTVDQMRRTITAATRPALRDWSRATGAYDGHSRDRREQLEAHLVDAYAATRTDLEVRDDNPAPDATVPDARCYTGEGINWHAKPDDDTAAKILSIVDRAKNAKPTAAPKPRANSTKTFVSADYPNGRHCDTCGRDLPVTAFFPASKGGVTRHAAECARCMDERRADANPTTALAQKVLAARDRRLAKEAAAAGNV